MSEEKFVRLIFLGDVVARPGREAVRERLAALRKEYTADVVVVNAENSAGGVGLDTKTGHELLAAGADALTLGDHTWRRKDVRKILDESPRRCIRPANYPEVAPGKGWLVIDGPGEIKIGVCNLLGRVFQNIPLDCPFNTIDKLLKNELKECKIIFCDIHAEASSEKLALARYLDGKVSLIVGTHTHIQTADEQILPEGTGYLSDAGMCGCLDGVLGLNTEAALERFITGVPVAYTPQMGPGVLNGVFCEINSITGKAVKIERISRY